MYDVLPCRAWKKDEDIITQLTNVNKKTERVVTLTIFPKRLCNSLFVYMDEPLEEQRSNNPQASFYSIKNDNHLNSGIFKDTCIPERVVFIHCNYYIIFHHAHVTHYCVLMIRALFCGLEIKKNMHQNIWINSLCISLKTHC